MNRALTMLLLFLSTSSCIPSGDSGTDSGGAGGSGGKGGKGGAGGSDAGDGGGKGGASGTGGDSGGSGGVGGDGGDAAVGCERNDDCEAPTPYCETSTGACVECMAHADCGDISKPECAGNACASCTDSAACAGRGNTLLCDTATGACVTCLGNGDCAAGTASRCDTGTHTCVACGADADCSHIAGQNVCDAGVCVECTGEKYSACGMAPDSTPYICDALLRTCTTEEEHGAGLCDGCVSDAHCATGQLCVMQRYDDPSTPEGEVDVGYYCFGTEQSAPGATCANTRPYVDTRMNSESIQGTMATICGLAVTTCTAYKDFRTKSCTDLSDDASCGDSRFPIDAYCELFAAGTYRCTTPCLSDDDCDIGTSCSASPPKFCNLQ